MPPPKYTTAQTDMRITIVQPCEPLGSQMPGVRHVISAEHQLLPQ